MSSIQFDQASRLDSKPETNHENIQIQLSRWHSRAKSWWYWCAAATFQWRSSCSLCSLHLTKWRRPTTSQKFTHSPNCVCVWMRADFFVVGYNPPVSTPDLRRPYVVQCHSQYLGYGCQFLPCSGSKGLSSTLFSLHSWIKRAIKKQVYISWFTRLRSQRKGMNRIWSAWTS